MLDRRQFLGLSGAAVATSFLGACSKFNSPSELQRPDGPPGAISLNASAWRQELGTPNVSPQSESDGWYLAMPPGMACYLVTKYNGGNPMGRTISFAMEIEASPDVVYDSAHNGDMNPGSLSLYFLSPYGDGRWWSRTPFVFQDGKTHDFFATAVTLAPTSAWGNVNGVGADKIPPSNDFSFQKAVASMVDIGFTLGGRSFDGHGLSVAQGWAKLHVRQYSIA